MRSDAPKVIGGARIRERAESDVCSQQTVSGAGELTRRLMFFVIVNDRDPLDATHCALCGGAFERSYVRDQQTRLLFCDTRCFAGHAYAARYQLTANEESSHVDIRSCL
jgi:hypothetical protein